MKLANAILTIILAGLIAIGIFSTLSCGSSSPVEPGATEPGGIQATAMETSGLHRTLGAWDLVIEEGRGIVEAIPRRTVMQHFDITQIALNGRLCPGCIHFQFGDIEQGGEQTFTVTIQNSYTGEIAGYDLKGIILADTSTDPTPPYESPWNLANPDDYTNLGIIPVSSTTRYPFRAFCPEDTERKLDVNETTSLTYELLFPPAPVDWKRITVSWMLDACESNCPEPYAIENQAVSGGIVPILGEKEEVSVDVRDHQGDTASVIIDASPLGGGGGGGGAISLTNTSGDTWSGDISASDDTAPGEYILEIEATDSIETGIKIWDYIGVTVDLIASQEELYTDTTGIIEDWDPDLVDCVMDELAEILGTDPDILEEPVTGFISDVQDLLGGPDEGSMLKWKVLRALKDLVSDLGDLGIDTTMRDFIDALRDALDSCLNGSWGWSGSTHNLPAGACTLDIGVIGGGAMAGQVLYTGNSPNCDTIRAYSADYSNNFLYKSLVNLDPNNLGFQPYPVLRIDAANDGAFSWTNDNWDYYQSQAYGNQPIRISSIWCTMDNTPAFHFVPIDDSRIFPVPVPPPQSGFRPVDVCDGFDKLQYALVVDPTLTILPHVWGLEGAPDNGDYTKLDDRYGATFPLAMIGPNDGQIEAGLGDFGGIDAYSLTETTARLYVAECGGQWALECFSLTDKGPGLNNDIVGAVYTVHFDTKPLDVELIPTNPDYEKNPNCPTVAVLLSSNDGTGYVSLHRATDGVQVDTIGSAQNGGVDNQAMYLDVNDGTCEIHVMQTGPQVTIFTLTWQAS